MAEKSKPATKVVIPCRISFANIWEPKSVNGGDERYSVSCLIPKTDTATLLKIDNAVEAATEDGKIRLWGGKIPSKLKTPMRDGDKERADDEDYAGMKFFNANSKEAPQIVDRKRDPITDPMTVYSGCYCNVSINFYAFSVNGNKGVAAGLGNIQLVKAGKRMAGRSSAMEDFDELEDDGEDVLGGADAGELPDWMK